MNTETVMLKAVKNRDAINPDKAPLRDFVFHDKNLSYYQDSLLQGIDLIQKSMAAAGKPFSGILPHELAAPFETIDLDQTLCSLDDALAEIKELYLNHAVYFHHPHYAAHLNCPIVVPAILAELLLTSINSSVDTWDQSTGGTLIEQKLLNWTAARIGFDDLADGVFTSGGTQ
ncbi:MAG: pyridoxal-dependent decarboxylase, partial [Gammaproteobacteria bacterium]